MRYSLVKTRKYTKRCAVIVMEDVVWKTLGSITGVQINHFISNHQSKTKGHIGPLSWNNPESASSFLLENGISGSGH